MHNQRVLLLSAEKYNSIRTKRILLEIMPEATVYPALQTIDNTFTWLSNNPHPDLILADIRLADGLSLEIFTKVNAGCPVVYISAYEEKTVAVLDKLNARYLLLPLEKEELKNLLKENRLIS